MKDGGKEGKGRSPINGHKVPSFKNKVIKVGEAAQWAECFTEHEDLRLDLTARVRGWARR